MSSLYLLCLSYRIPKKDIFTEYKRQQYLIQIGEQFADAIVKKGGFEKKTKTAEKSSRMGTKLGIRALMERWFLIQELEGVRRFILYYNLGK